MATSKIIEQAQKIAENKSETLDSALNVYKGGASGSGTITLKENAHPANNKLAAHIKLLTYYGGNINNNNIAVESYYISPQFKGVLKCQGTQKNVWYLPLPNSTYAIKFYAPDEYDPNYYNYVFAVPAKIDATYITGFKDYTTGIPQEWLNAFVRYASSLPSNVIPNNPSRVPSNNASKNFSSDEAKQKIKFVFNFWGSLSGSLGKSASFSFEYTFYPGAVPNAPIVVGTGSGSLQI